MADLPPSPAPLIVRGPTPAFQGASWLALGVGIIAYITGLWNATMELNEKGYYLTVFLFALFAAVSVQKTVRDQEEGVPVTSIYLGISWFALLASVVLLVVGLWNATLTPSEKGFYGMAFTMALFAAIAVQKNIRDIARLPVAPAPLFRRPSRDDD